uniref:Toxoplasma gondii family C protein n=1 Tax=Toxoplasma gondii (strain ATCC 50861 / VEG) TaxID=432359 RepID=A0A0F7URQ0_TOXGV|nr:TPA: Toxoplasma gondii family C protein [Toxoplasma gondii VEG]
MMKPAAKEIVPSRGVNNDQMGMENTSEKKCFGFSVGSHFPSEPKTRPAWRFRHNSRVVLLCVALCLTVLSSFVSYESSTPRMYTALSAAAADVDTDSLVDTDSWTESGEEGTTVDDGATEADDGAVELQGDAAEAEGGANELYGTDFENQPKIIRLARTWLRKDPRVAALVSKVERFGPLQALPFLSFSVRSFSSQAESRVHHLRKVQALGLQKAVNLLGLRKGDPLMILWYCRWSYSVVWVVGGLAAVAIGVTIYMMTSKGVSIFARFRVHDGTHA